MGFELWRMKDQPFKDKDKQIIIRGLSEVEYQ